MGESGSRDKICSTEDGANQFGLSSCRAVERDGNEGEFRLLPLLQTSPVFPHRIDQSPREVDLKIAVGALGKWGQGHKRTFAIADSERVDTIIVAIRNNQFAVAYRIPPASASIY